jgi:hypothetical protein
LLLLTNNSSSSSTTPDVQTESSQANGSSIPREPMYHVDSAEQPSSAAAAAAAAGSSQATTVDAEQSDYCLMTLPTALAGSAGVESWRLLLPAQPDAVVTDMDVFDCCVVLHEIRSAQPGVRLVQLAEQQGAQQLPELHVAQQQQVSHGWHVMYRDASASSQCPSQSQLVAINAFIAAQPVAAWKRQQQIACVPIIVAMSIQLKGCLLACKDC